MEITTKSPIEGVGASHQSLPGRSPACGRSPTTMPSVHSRPNLRGLMSRAMGNSNSNSNSNDSDSDCGIHPSDFETPSSCGSSPNLRHYSREIHTETETEERSLEITVSEKKDKLGSVAESVLGRKC